MGLHRLMDTKGPYASSASTSKPSSFELILSYCFVRRSYSQLGRKFSGFVYFSVVGIRAASFRLKTATGIEFLFWWPFDGLMTVIVLKRGYLYCGGYRVLIQYIYPIYMNASNMRSLSFVRRSKGPQETSRNSPLSYIYIHIYATF